MKKDLQFQPSQDMDVFIDSLENRVFVLQKQRIIDVIEIGFAYSYKDIRLTKSNLKSVRTFK